jgi:hypothetical protein
VADLATLQSRLAEAEAAYHQLLTGALEVETGHGDMRTKWNQVTRADLAAYLQDLHAQIAAAGGTTTGLRRRAVIVDLPGSC